MLDNRVLIVGPLFDHACAEIAARLDTRLLPAGADATTFLAEAAPEVEALVLAQAVDEAFIDRFPRLRLVANFGVGYDNLPTRHCAARGIVVVHTPDVLTADVADTAWGLLLMATRRFSAAERYLRDGRWAADGMFPLSASLQGRRLGILGLGRIGAAVARRAAGFDLPVAYHDVAPRPDQPYQWLPSAVEVAAAVDLLVAVLPGGDATRRMVDGEVFEALGPNGIFVNVGRGTAVDQPALIDALARRTILGAGLDVYESEPHLPPDLLGLDNVVLLPHVASGTEHSRKAMTRLVVDNLVAFFTTGRALTPVPETPNPA